MFSDENMTQPIGNILGYTGDSYSGGVFLGDMIRFHSWEFNQEPQYFFSLEANLNREPKKEVILLRELLQLVGSFVSSIEASLR